MLKHPLLRGWRCTRPYQLSAVAALLMASGIITLDSSAFANRAVKAGTSTHQVRSQKALPNSAPVTPQATEQLDPLDSPHPIPWNWVMKTYEQVSATKGSAIRYYRTPALISPDGKYAAYTRIQMRVQPDLYESHVSSTLFVENVQTKQLQVIYATSPLANNPLKSNEPGDMPGIISILIPVSWSATGDRLLARQFEGGLSASDASDFAVVWDRRSNRSTTIVPNDIEYSSAILLGWSRTNPNQVIFRAGDLGDEQQPLWAVGLNGQTIAAATGDQPVVFGSARRYAWVGPQNYWSFR